MKKEMKTIEMCSSSAKARIVRLLGATNSFPEKGTLVASLTRNRTEEVHLMYAVEAEAFAAMLEKRDKSMNNMRRKIIALAHQMGWKDVKDKTGKTVDYYRIDSWIKRYSLSKLAMKQLPVEQLTLVCNQFEAMWRKEVSRV